MRWCFSPDLISRSSIEDNVCVLLQLIRKKLNWNVIFYCFLTYMWQLLSILICVTHIWYPDCCVFWVILHRSVKDSHIYLKFKSTAIVHHKHIPVQFSTNMWNIKLGSIATKYNMSYLTWSELQMVFYATCRKHHRKSNVCWLLPFFL